MKQIHTCDTASGDPRVRGFVLAKALWEVGMKRKIVW
jgi:hypothetical protein